MWEGAIDLCDFIDSSPDEVICIDKSVLEVIFSAYFRPLVLFAKLGKGDYSASVLLF